MKTGFVAPVLLAAVLSPSLLAAPFSFTFHNRKRINHKMGLAQSSSTTAKDSSMLASSVDGRVSDVDTSSAEGLGAPMQQPAPTLPLSQHHEPYNPPSSRIHPIAHYIFLVHGWLGNDLEMSYLSESFALSIAAQNSLNENSDGDDTHDAKRVKRSPSQLDAIQGKTTNSNESKTKYPLIVVHSVKCNVGKTHDGIKNGGTRLAHEMVDFIRNDLQKQQRVDSGGNMDDTNAPNESMKVGHVTYSIVGNSLGGLYARYAISLVPRQVSIPRPIHDNSKPSNQIQQRIYLHPNIFITTATPHLGVSQHTYLPIPRIAETIIGSGMGATGKDLFRLNSDKTGRENVIGLGVRKLSGNEGMLSHRSWRLNGSGDDKRSDDKLNNVETLGEEVDQEMECIIRNMCLQETYLRPLRHFRKRIAYANAYRTDFQVPTETAAFLNVNSDVRHTVLACRDVSYNSSINGSDNIIKEYKHEKDDVSSSNGYDALPPFVVAVVRTDQQSPQQVQQAQLSDSSSHPSDELLNMSQSLDALGWTKVFIDVRNRIPLPGITKPSWRLLPFPSVLSTMLPEPDKPLDDLIHSRGFNQLADASCSSTTLPKCELTKTEKSTTVTSSELIQSTNAGQTVHFPMGHTVMVANSKSDTYTKLNYQGRPVMDKLAEDMLSDVLEFE